MDWVSIGKFAVKTVAGSSVGGVIMNVVKATIPPNTKPLQRVRNNFVQHTLYEVIRGHEDRLFDRGGAQR